MTDQELIKQLKQLKKIKPNREWVILCKQEILGAQSQKQVPAETEKSAFAAISNIFSNVFFKPAFATIACFGLIFTVFGVAQSALPGDLLYPAKKITEKVQLNLASEQEKPKAQIAMTNKKFQELNQVVQANLGRNLAPAIQEVEQSAQETAKTLEKLVESVKVIDIPEETVFVNADTSKVKEIVAQMQEIEQTKQEVEKTLGVIVETPELDEAISDCYKTLVEQEMQRMASQILTEDQETTLTEIQALYEQEQYQQAWEHFLLNQ
ncbi:hypothetical protein KAW43_03790 [Candidatus Parcubacteria bacterium]|nr:hypothetical protein [Candidatus Parcubacteria bacterium]